MHSPQQFIYDPVVLTVVSMEDGNDHTENQETVASWLTPSAHKIKKTETTTDLFYYEIKPKRNLLKSSGSHADITPGHTGTQAGLCRRTHLRFIAGPHQTLF